MIGDAVWKLPTLSPACTRRNKTAKDSRPARRLRSQAGKSVRKKNFEPFVEQCEGGIM
jgi:hypothetical protein